MRKFLVLGALAAAAVAIPGQAGAQTACNAAIGNPLAATVISGDLVVNKGQNCLLYNVHVDGNVNVNGGGLMVFGSSVTGNLTAMHPAYFVMDAGVTLPVGFTPNSVQGSVIILGGTGVAPPLALNYSGSNTICATEIGGNLKLMQSKGPFFVGESNASPCSADPLPGNDIGQNVILLSNRGGVFVSNNNIGLSLICLSNKPAASGGSGSNSVSAGAKAGDCRSL